MSTSKRLFLALAAISTASHELKAQVCMQEWHGSIGQPGTTSGVIGTMYEWNHALYVGGTFTTLGGQDMNRVARWLPAFGGWSPLDDGCAGLPTDRVVAMTDLNFGEGSELVVGGTFASASGVLGTEGLARWNGSAWRSIPDVHSATVNGLAAYNNSLYLAGGVRFPPGGGIAGVIKFTPGIGWTQVGNPAAFSDIPDCIAVYNNEIVVAGTFDAQGGVTPYVAKWDGSTWQPVGAGLTQLAGPVTQVRFLTPLSDGKLYISGTAGGLHFFQAWDGVSWSRPGSGQTDVLACAIFPFSFPGPTLVTSGSTPSGHCVWYKSTPTMWFALPGIFQGIGSTPAVNCMLVFEDRLVVGGNFISPDYPNVPANSIAAFGCVCIADRNDDGMVDYADYLDFVSDFDSGDPSADINGDGLVDFGDYLDFLSHYGAGC